MKVVKHYEQDHVVLYVTEGDTVSTTILLDSEAQMRRLANCLTDLCRTDGRQATCEPRQQTATGRTVE